MSAASWAALQGHAAPRHVATQAPEQAFAVVELLDDLRDRIWAHYSAQLLDQYRKARPDLRLAGFAGIVTPRDPGGPRRHMRLLGPVCDRRPRCAC